MTRTSLLFDRYVEEYAIHTVLRHSTATRSGLCLWCTLFLAPTIGEFSSI
jgi:hypothetical protein